MNRKNFRVRLISICLSLVMMMGLMANGSLGVLGFAQADYTVYAEKYNDYIAKMAIGKGFEWNYTQLADLNRDGTPEMLVISGNMVNAQLNASASNMKILKALKTAQVKILKLNKNTVSELKSNVKFSFSPQQLGKSDSENQLLYIKTIKEVDYLCLYSTLSQKKSTTSALTVYNLNQKSELSPVVKLIGNTAVDSKGKSSYTLNGKAITKTTWLKTLQTYKADATTYCLQEVDQKSAFVINMSPSNAMNWKTIHPFSDAYFNPPAATTFATKNDPIVTLTLSDASVIKIQLYPKVAKNTVDHFIDLSQKGFYNDLTFHRIIKGFMIQGGDPLGTGTGGPGYSISGEFSANGFDNPLSHTRGVISMARAAEFNSAGSQFFIMHADSPFLDGNYAAFGKVIAGLDVVDRIAGVKTGSMDEPLEKVVIQSVTVDLNGYVPGTPKTIPSK